MPSPLKSVVTVTLLAISATGCDSSSDSGQPLNAQQGIFADSPVSGLYYREVGTSKWLSTDNEGRFTYSPDSIYEFSIGPGIHLGKSEAKTLVIIGDLDDPNLNETINQNRLHNTARLIQSLDSNLYAEDGIQLPVIPEDTQHLLDTIDLTLDPEKFADSEGVGSLMHAFWDDNTMPISLAQALDHYENESSGAKALASRYFIDSELHDVGLHYLVVPETTDNAAQKWTLNFKNHLVEVYDGLIDRNGFNSVVPKHVSSFSLAKKQLILSTGDVLSISRKHQAGYILAVQCGDHSSNLFSSKCDTSQPVDYKDANLYSNISDAVTNTGLAQKTSCEQQDDGAITCTLTPAQNQIFVEELLSLARDAHTNGGHKDITDDTTVMVQAWGASGGKGAPNTGDLFSFSTLHGGNGGSGGYVQQFTSLKALSQGQQSIAYFVGQPGCPGIANETAEIAGHSGGGGGGAASTVIGNEFILGDLSHPAKNISAIAGGGSGGNAATTNDAGAQGNRGGVLINLPSTPLSVSQTVNNLCYNSGENLSREASPVDQSDQTFCAGENTINSTGNGNYGGLGGSGSSESLSFKSFVETVKAGYEANSCLSISTFSSWQTSPYSNSFRLVAHDQVQTPDGLLTLKGSWLNSTISNAIKQLSGQGEASSDARGAGGGGYRGGKAGFGGGSLSTNTCDALSVPSSQDIPISLEDVKYAGSDGELKVTFFPTWSCSSSERIWTNSADIGETATDAGDLNIPSIFNSGSKLRVYIEQIAIDLGVPEDSPCNNSQSSSITYKNLYAELIEGSLATLSIDSADYEELDCPQNNRHLTSLSGVLGVNADSSEMTISLPAPDYAHFENNHIKFIPVVQSE